MSQDKVQSLYTLSCIYLRLNLDRATLPNDLSLSCLSVLVSHIKKVVFVQKSILYWDGNKKKTDPKCSRVVFRPWSSSRRILLHNTMQPHSGRSTSLTDADYLQKPDLSEFFPPKTKTFIHTGNTALIPSCNKEKKCSYPLLVSVQRDFIRANS